MKNEDFKDIYEKYQRFSTRLALSIVKDSGAAEDISQDVFCNLYKLGSRLDASDEKKLCALITTATVNRARDYLKKAHMKWEVNAMDTAVTESYEDKKTNIEAKLVSMEEMGYQMLVLQKLRRVNRMNYDILIKVKYLDIPPEAVAKEYGITRNNVNNRIRRSRLWLEKELAKLHQN